MKDRKITIFLLLLYFPFSSAISQSLEWISNPGRYSEITYMGNDMFKVKTNTGKFGIINQTGQEIIKAEYDSITSFVENRALLLDERGKRILSIINHNGEIIKSFTSEPIYTTKYPFYKEGLLCFRNQENLFGYLNLHGDVSISTKYHYCAPFQNGIAVIQHSDENGYYGLINKSGGAAIISNKRYSFLSSLVDGFLFAVSPYSRGGDVLEIMKIEDNTLKSVRKLESQMFIYVSDDNDNLYGQNDHHYLLDNQLRVVGFNYDQSLPYKVYEFNDNIKESSEQLKKIKVTDGYLITYNNNPVIQTPYNETKIFENKYAIVKDEKSKVGLLKINNTSDINLVEDDYNIILYHNNNDVDTRKNTIKIPLTTNGIEISELECFVNENGDLNEIRIYREDDEQFLLFPYFQPDTLYDNKIDKNVDLLFYYHGFEWKKKSIAIHSVHKEGFDISISGSDKTNDKGVATFDIKINSIDNISCFDVFVNIENYKSVTFSGTNQIIPIKVMIPNEGDKKTFTFNISVLEKGCPIMKKSISKSITYPVSILPKELKK